MKTINIVGLFVLASMLGYADPAKTEGKEVADFTLPDGKKVELAVDSLKMDPQIVTGKLENGLTYYIRPNAEPKGRMSIRLRVDTGSLNEVEENQGIAHFIEHLVFNGSKHFKRGELTPIMQRHGLGFGGDANAFTSFDQTVYMLDLPNLEDKTTDLAFTIVRDFADGALLEESAIDFERGIIESELKVRDSASHRVMMETFAFLLPGTKIPDRFPIGTLDFIRNGKRELFLDYYKTQYIPSQMQLIIVGDVTVDQARTWINKYFGDMQASEYNFKPDWGKLEEQKQPAAKWLNNKELSSTDISLVNVKPYDKKADTAAQRLEDFPLHVAMGMLNMRFSRMTEKADCPFVSAGMSRYDLFQMVDVISVDVTSTHENWKESLTRAEQEVRRAIQYGFSEAELEEVSKNMINSAEVSVKGWPTVKSAGLANAIQQRISQDELFTAPEESLRLIKDGLEMLKKNPVLCQKALQQAWNVNTVQMVVTSNVENKDGAREIMDCFNAASQEKVEAIKEEELKPFAYDQIGEPGKVASTSEVEDLGITQLVLSNGIKVNLKSTEFSKDSISIRFSIDGGDITRPLDKVGLNRMAAAVMGGGGLEAHSDEELGRLMAGHSVGAGFMVDKERFVVYGSTTPADLELQLKLMVAQVMHPGYRPEAEMKYRRALPLFYARLRHEPNGALGIEGMKFLLNDDKRFNFPTQKQAEECTTEDVKAWVDSYLKNGYMEVSVVGDFKKSDIIPLLEKTVGALPKRPEAPAKIDYRKQAVELAKSGESKNIDYPSKIDRTLVCTVWKTGDGFDRERTIKISVLRAIMADRLFKGIREKIGEAYSPFVTTEMSRTYPGLGFMMGICPGVVSNKDTVIKAVNEIAGELGQGKIDQDELDRATRPMVNSLEKDLRTNGYWMGVIGDSQADPVDIEMARKKIGIVRNLTLEEINELAKEVFKPGNSVNINIMPNGVEAEEGQNPRQPEAEKKAA